VTVQSKSHRTRGEIPTQNPSPLNPCSSTTWVGYSILPMAPGIVTWYLCLSVLYRGGPINRRERKRYNHWEEVPPYAMQEKKRYIESGCYLLPTTNQG